ncbi:MAG: hypothetical protein ACHBNF_18035 [Chromatiales bacterium]
MDDPIPISALNQYAYCSRRYYLIHAEAEFEGYIVAVHAEQIPRGVELWAWNAIQGTLVKT